MCTKLGCQKLKFPFQQVVTDLHKDTFLEMLFFSVPDRCRAVLGVFLSKPVRRSAHREGKRRLTRTDASGGAWGLYLNRFHLV